MDDDNYYSSANNYENTNNYESSLGYTDRYFNENEDDGDYEMLSLVNLSKKKLADDNQNSGMINQDARLKRINRGYSARRYLSNWTRHWDQKLLNNLIKDGKLNEETIYESNEINSSNKQRKRRLDDDLSVIPPDYRIHRHWLFTPGNLKGYRFFKVQDNYLTRAFNGKLFCKTLLQKNKVLFKDYFKHLNRLDTDNQDFDAKSNPNTPVKQQHKQEPIKTEKQAKKAEIIVPDPIKICNDEGKEIAYDKLENIEKENVLSELLFHSALKNIAERQIVSRIAINDFLIEILTSLKNIFKDVFNSVMNDTSKVVTTSINNLSSFEDTVSKEKDNHL